MNELKRCPKCETVLNISCFAKNRARKDGLQDRCRECDKAYNAKRRESHKKWRAKPENAEAAKKRTAQWRKDNPERNKENVEGWTIQHSEERKSYHTKYQRERKDSDPNFKLRCLLRGRINSCIRFRKKSGKWSGKKAGSAVTDLGCSIPVLISTLEAKFDSTMSWDNHGTHWELDHIVPLVTFDLTDRKQFLEACHYTNLQPLSIEDHLEKTTRESTGRCKNSIGQ